MFAFALWDEASSTLVLRARPLRHQAVLLRASSATCSTSRPRPRRCCRSCRRSRPTSTGFKDYLTFQFCLGGKTLFKGVHELLPGHSLRRAQRRRRDAALLGGLLRARLRPHGAATSRSGSRELLDGLGRRAPAHRRAGRRLPQRRPRLEHRRGARGREQQAPTFHGFTGKFDDGAGYDESRYARDARRRTRGFDLHEVDITADDFVGHDRATSSTTSTTRWPGRARSRSTWSRELARAAPQGRARRPGRRRDLRRLRALPDRVLRAVHQGGDRRHDARRQLRRHLRVDHPEPRRAARLQAAAAGVLARRAVRATSTRATSA